MEFIEWSDSMSTGVKVVDDDHKILLSLLNKLYKYVNNKEKREVLGNALDKLVDYTVYHFDREEKIMQAGHYPNLQKHHNIHENLKAQVAKIAHQFNEQKEDVIAQELLEFLKDWLINHILKEDMAFRPFCEDNNEVDKLIAKL